MGKSCLLVLTETEVRQHNQHSPTVSLAFHMWVEEQESNEDTSWKVFFQTDVELHALLETEEVTSYIFTCYPKKIYQNI